MVASWIVSFFSSYRCWLSLGRGVFVGRQLTVLILLSPTSSLIFLSRLLTLHSKAHALDGHILSLFLIQHFMDALQELAEHDVKDPERMLAQLKEEDDIAFANFTNAPLVDTTHSSHDILAFKGPKNVTWDEEHKDWMDLLYKGNSICRTARTPSQTRYLGHMTNNGKTGGIAALGNETYETGIQFELALETAKESNEEMRLVYVEKQDVRDRNCMNQIQSPDYKDFFMAHANEGWVKMTFPNPAEKDAYGYDPSKFKGLLAIVMRGCAWGKCRKEDIRAGDGASVIEEGTLEITVNGKNVTSFYELAGILALVGEQGMYWEPNQNGDYEVAVRVKQEKSHFTISALILY